MTAVRTPSAIPHRIHALGAGGAGVSGALLVLAERGASVSGVEAADSPHLALLRARGIPVGLEGGVLEPLADDVELVFRSAAIGDDHPHVAAARARGVPVWKYGELLAALCPPGRTLAVAGTHGKTTTSWMLQHALAEAPSADLDQLARPRASEPRPGAVIGGLCRTLGVNALAGDPGGWFAVEACEYDRTFLGLTPYAAAITNVEADHLDYYGDLAAIVDAFAAFAARVDRAGLLVVGAEVPAAIERAARCPVWRLGRDFAFELERAERHPRPGPVFRLRGLGAHPLTVALGVPGAFNVENAALALALAQGVTGRDPQRLAAGLARFAGVRRRFEPWGSVAGVELVHDYAHHPTELRCTLAAARERLESAPKAAEGARLHVLFQPHQHSRTARLFDDFVESLAGADRVVVTDVYGARTHIDRVAAGAPELVAGLVARGVDAHLGGPLSSAARIAASGVRCGDLLLVVGAGDIESLRSDLCDDLAHLALRGASGSVAR